MDSSTAKDEGRGRESRVSEGVQGLQVNRAPLRREWFFLKSGLTNYPSQLSFSKTYFSENAYNAHLLSKRHKELEAAAATATGSSSPEPEEQQPGTVEPTPDDAMDTESTTPQQRNWKAEMANAETDEQLAALIEEKRATAPRLPPTHCIFCPHASESTEDNLEHMSRAHSFFLPYVDQIEDLEGLLRGLADVVTVENLCLYCGDTGRRMHSLDAVRKHMLDKGHAKIGEEIEEFVEEYYDFEEEEEEGMEVDFYNGRREGLVAGSSGQFRFPHANESNLQILLLPFVYLAHTSPKTTTSNSPTAPPPSPAPSPPSTSKTSFHTTATPTFSKPTNCLDTTKNRLTCAKRGERRGCRTGRGIGSVCRWAREGTGCKSTLGSRRRSERRVSGAMVGLFFAAWAWELVVLGRHGDRCRSSNEREETFARFLQLGWLMESVSGINHNQQLARFPSSLPSRHNSSHLLSPSKAVPPCRPCLLLPSPTPPTCKDTPATRA